MDERIFSELMLVTAAKHAINLLPEPAATSITCALAALTRRPKVSPSERHAMQQAKKLYYGEHENVAWAWGDGPLVVLVHGWGGRATQMAPLAAHIAELGFRSVAPDITGHGDSPKRHTRWEYFLRDISALTRSLGGDVYAYVGHSAGGLSMMAARKLEGIRARRYVCICAPSYPFPPIRVIEKKLHPRRGVLLRYQEYIAAQFATTWQRLETGCSYESAGRDLLLFYDETDRFVPHTEGDRIRALCPESRLVKTSSYGHSEILSAPELSETVGAFLTEPPPEVGVATSRL